MFKFIALFALGCLLGNFIEWFVHRFVLHALARKFPKVRALSFHLEEHHIATFQNDYRDPTYTEDSIFTLKPNPKSLEFFGIVGGMIAPLTLLFFVSTPFALGTISWILFHYFAHVISHVKPEIGKKYFRVHWDHHMVDETKNFCVTVPLMDYIFGTRKK